MVGLGTRIQKLTRKPSTNIGKINYEAELVVLDIRRDQVHNEHHRYSTTVARPLELGAASGWDRVMVGFRVHKFEVHGKTFTPEKNYDFPVSVKVVLA